MKNLSAVVGHVLSLVAGAAVLAAQTQPILRIEAWTERRPEVPAGKLVSRSVRSVVLNADRDVTVYTSSDFDASAGRVVVLVILDGPTYLEAVPGPVILDNLRFAGRIPPVIAVFVTQKDRQMELYANPMFSDFLATELVPWTSREFGIDAHARDTVIAGPSAGGLAAAFAAWRHSAVFGNVLTQPRPQLPSAADSRESSTHAVLALRASAANRLTNAALLRWPGLRSRRARALGDLSAFLNRPAPESFRRERSASARRASGITRATRSRSKSSVAPASPVMHAKHDNL